MVILSEANDDDYKYDVFLSFRGFDTRLSFTNHLHTALVNANLTTFLDDQEIQTGEELKPELEGAIKASRASVIVLSKNYASSRWCLDELVLILEQKRKFDKIVIPIFYHVEPTDIRKQQNSFGDAMAEHKQRIEAETDVEKKGRLAEKMELWKNALTQVSNLKGIDAKGRLETEFIEEIVKNIYYRLRLPLKSTLPLLIGMDDSIKFVTSWLKNGSSHTVDILTILGIGGIGKTSLARYVYGLHYLEFSGSSFVENISRRCGELDGLLNVQKQLCDNISKRSLIQVYDSSVYTSTIQKVLARKKVFLVLDDVDTLDQLDALLGSQGLCLGSKIIVTTKDASLTERCTLFISQVQNKHTTHLLEGLYKTASHKLLCFHAFKCENPKVGYEEVSDNIVKYCEGHPLALEVLGRSLYNRDVAYWEESIKGLKKETDSRIKKALQMSFDSLPYENDKDLFKYIACFFVGVERDFAETILSACDINTTTGISRLFDRCLLCIGCNGELTMHSLIQEMGRDVVDKESPDHPEKRTRVWRSEDSFKVLKKKKGTNILKGLALDMRILEKEKFRGSFELKTDALSSMENLMILHLNYVQLSGSYDNFPEELRWLCMHGFPLKSIPSDLPMEYLVVLDMSYSHIDSFDLSYGNPEPPAKRQKQLIGSSSKHNPLLGSLKILVLSFCEQLRSLYGFCEIPALERLIVRNCTSLIEVCESVEQCGELFLVDFSYCNEYRKFAKTIGKLKTVKTLLLDGCSFGAFEVGDMDSLTKQKANSINIDSQTSSSAIVEAIPRDFKSLTFSFPSSLVSLSLVYSNLSNESFPMDFSSLSMLTDLDLDGNPIVSMPNCVRKLAKLEYLSMSNCGRLMSIEHAPRSLNLLSIYNNNGLQKIAFDPEMSPLKVVINVDVLGTSSIDIAGIIKIQPMEGIEGNVIRSLGWSNSELIEKLRGGTDQSECQMYYEFGIFSTIYGGEGMPNWIEDRSEGPSISFTIPSSPNMLRGLNVCYVQALPFPYETFGLPLNRLTFLPLIKISNITNNRTWIYKHYLNSVNVGEECLSFLSHWMFGMNEMEAGDQVTVTVKHDFEWCSILTCGVSFVYDDANIEEVEEDPLGYYKSWNHIIGGDLSGFQLTTGEYYLHSEEYTRITTDVCTNPLIADYANYKVDEVYFKAFSQRKFNGRG